MDLFSELKKRKVFATAAFYIPGAWLAAEIFIFLADRLGAPQWVGDIVAVLFVLGFPVALLLSWLFDVSKDGVKSTSPGTPMGIIALLASGLFLSTGAYISYQVFSGRMSQISVAILPLKTNATVPAAQPYGLSIADSLRSSLQQIPAFRVPARTSSEAVVKAGLDIPGIASKLGVQYIVEGTLEMVAQKLSISISLVDSGGSVRWSERFERATRDLFDLQNDLVRAVALELGLNESNTYLQKNIRKAAPTQDMEAHRLFLQGKYIEVEPGASMVESDGMQALKAARQRDPGYAAVYPAIAFLYGIDCWMVEDRNSPNCTLAINYATQGLALDPEQGDALTTLAFVHSLRYEYPEAQAAIDRFLALPDQSFDFPSLPFAYQNLGRLQLAWDSALEHYRNDPVNMWSVGDLAGWAYLFKKDDVMAQHFENMMIEMVGFSILSGYPAAKMHRVDVETAIQDFANIVPMWGISPEFAPEYADTLVRQFYDPSLRQNAVQKFQTWYESGAITPFSYWESLIFLYQTDQAIEMAFDLFDQRMLNPVMFFIDDPGRKEFRAHPRFIALVEHIGLAAYWDEVGWPLPCELRGEQHFCGLDWAVQ